MGNSPSSGRIGDFIDHGDGTVTDTRTGLMWMLCVLGQTCDGRTCAGKAQGYTWDEAMALRYDFAGHGDWRLPDIDELISVVDKTRGSPAIDTAAFPTEPDQAFWSASVYDGNSDVAWGVAFGYGCGGTYDKTLSFQVHLVRGGQYFGTLNGDVTSKAIGSPVKEASAKSIVRAAIAFIRQRPELFPAEIAELRGFLGETGAIPVSAPAAAKPESDAKPVEASHHTTPVRAPAATKRPAPAVSETLKQVVAWLMAQETVALSDLRAHLLPLDLLPSAVIDDLNERALDITGDPALEDDGDCIIVVREVLVQVVSTWQGQ